MLPLPSTRSASTTIVLVLANVALAALIAVQALPKSPVSPAAMPDAGTEPSLVEPWAPKAPLISSRTLGQRRLFGAGGDVADDARSRTADASLESSSAIERPPPDYRLLGTFINPRGRSVALLSDADNASLTIGSGERLEDWLFDSVESRSVRMHGSGAELIIEMTDADTDEVPADGSNGAPNDEAPSARNIVNSVDEGLHSTRPAPARRYQAPRR